MKTAKEWSEIIIDGCYLTNSRLNSLEDIEQIVRQIQIDVLQEAIKRLPTEEEIMKEMTDNDVYGYAVDECKKRISVIGIQ